MRAIVDLEHQDPVWDQILSEANKMVAREQALTSLVKESIFQHGSLKEVMAYRLALKLASPEMEREALEAVLSDVLQRHPYIIDDIRADIIAVYDRDPACSAFLQPVMYFKGFLALQASRIAHQLWREKRKDLAYFLQMRISEKFGVDIHPGAVIGKGIMIDHAHSIVIGETARVGNNVSMLHSVTLGGTGKEDDDRHPKIGDGVLIGAGAKVLGNIRVGECSRIAAGSVVLKDVPECKTVAGIPAKIVGEAGCLEPAQTMNHLFTKTDV